MSFNRTLDGCSQGDGGLGKTFLIVDGCGMMNEIEGTMSFSIRAWTGS
jgi:hypothetical protein